MDYYVVEMTKFFHTESNRSSRVAMRLLAIGYRYLQLLPLPMLYNMRYMTFVVGQNDHVGARSDELSTSILYASHFCVATHIFSRPAIGYIQQRYNTLVL